MTGTGSDASTTTTGPAASPEALLKAAVTGGRDKAPDAPPAPARMKLPKLTRKVRSVGIAAAALTLGAAIGSGATAVSTQRPDTSADTLAQLDAALEAGRSETSRLGGEIERLGKALAQLRETGEGTRSEGKARGATLSERIARLEQGLGAKLSGLGDRLDQAERNQIVRLDRLTTQIEKRLSVAAAPVAPPVSAPAPVEKSAAQPEPAQTGSIGEAKPKPAAIENWAVREVYDGVAMLEDRKRRLVEVGPGDAVPGIGRVEAIERRGRQWVVVTKQGLITPQTW